MFSNSKHAERWKAWKLAFNDTASAAIFQVHKRCVTSPIRDLNLSKCEMAPWPTWKLPVAHWLGTTGLNHWVTWHGTAHIWLGSTDGTVRPGISWAGLWRRAKELESVGLSNMRCHQIENYWHSANILISETSNGGKLHHFHSVCIWMKPQITLSVPSFWYMFDTCTSMQFKDEFLFCDPVPETKKATDILQMVKSSFAKQDFNKKKDNGSLCADGRSTCNAGKKRVDLFLWWRRKHLSSLWFVTHCFQHPHALTSKTLPTPLKEILSTCVKVVNLSDLELWINAYWKNFVKKWVRNMKFFCTTQKFAGFQEVKFWSVWWSLERKLGFLIEKQGPLSVHSGSEEFIYGLAFLADIFSHMAEVNLLASCSDYGC